MRVGVVGIRSPAGSGTAPLCACGCSAALKYDPANHEWHHFVKNKVSQQ